MGYSANTRHALSELFTRNPAHPTPLTEIMQTQPSPTKLAAGEKPLVLVVDDEYGPRESIAFTLSSEFTVETADRAAEALNRIKLKPYALVVMDIRMESAPS